MSGAREKTRRLNIVVGDAMYEELSTMASKTGESKSEIVRAAVEMEIERRKIEALEKAAADLAALYRRNEDLTAFTVLDAEDFV